MTQPVSLPKAGVVDKDALFLINSAAATPVPGVVRAKDIYSMLLIGYTNYAGAANITTSSTSFVPISDTAFPAISADLDSGDIVWCKFSAILYNGTNAYVYIDVLVDRPISADHYIGQDVYGLAGGIGYCYGGVGQAQTTVIPYVATESGIHTFKMVWKVSGNTGYFMAGGSSNEDQSSFFSVSWCP